MKKVKIFLASSAELDEDKEKFELFISKKNKDLLDKRIFLELTTWKDFISSIRDGRTQDEYNDYIKASDISIFLFHTKIGRFTQEEFDNAHKAFRACKHKNKTPRIYTYFKTDNNETPEITDFRNHIDALDHFYDTYEDMNDLFVKFGRQLDKLENESIILKPETIDSPKIIKYAIYYFILPILVLAGGFFSFYYFQPTDLTVKVKEVEAIPGLPFEEGKVTLTYGDKTETIDIKNEVTFKQIPSKYKHDKVKLNFKARGFVAIDTLVQPKDLIELTVRRDNSLGIIFGSIKDESNLPVKDVVINVKDIQTKTDENGRFRINIPLIKQAEEQRMTAFKEGYQLWDFTGTPSQTTDWKIILKK